MKLLDRIEHIKNHMKEPVLLVKGEQLNEVYEALKMKEKFEEQTPEDISNPLEPIKVYSAFKSEVMKLEYRKANKPDAISVLDYTILECLQKVLEEVSE